MSMSYQKADGAGQPLAEAMEDVYALSPLQQGMLFHHLYEEHSGVDIEQVVYTLHDGLHVSAFKRAWQQVVDRHAVLRTGFRWEGLDTPLQLVRRQIKLEWEEVDWRLLPAVEQSARLDDYLRRDRRRGFAMTEPTLNRMALFRESDSDYQFVWTFHHAILDGRSIVAVLKEVLAYYEAFCDGGDLTLPLPRRYRDYIDWLDRLNLSRAETYWRETLRGFTSPTPLVVKRNAGDVPTGEIEYTEQGTRLSRATTDTLRAFAQTIGVTLNTLVQGAWAMLLGRYSGADEVVFGTTRACRRTTFEDAESIVGLMINTLPMRVHVEPLAALGEWLKQIRCQHTALRDVEHTPLIRVEEWSEVPRGRSLFDSILVFENYAMGDYLKAQGERWQNCEFELLERTNYPLALSGWAGPELLLKLAYHQRDFDDAAINRMLGHLRTLLENMPARSEQPLARLPMLTAQERNQLLVGWNDTQADYPAQACVHQLFESQVERTPEALAVMCGSEQLSYSELNARANQLARHLQTLGVGRESLVAIALERSSEMIVAMLAVLKAGGAYVPLDPAYPQERLAAMLEDARPVVLITQQRLRDRLPSSTACLVVVDDWSQIATQACDNLPANATPANLAYIIYTSGSTGKPKGVMIEHGALVNYTHGASLEHAIAQGDRVLQFASISFDASVEEIFPCLLRGATLVLRSDEMLASSSAFLAQCRAWQITVLDLPTAFWHELTERLNAQGAELPASLRLVIIGGERARPDRVAAWQRQVAGRVRLLNTYGPTETTVVAAAGDLTQAMRGQASDEVSIGTPVANTEVYILDANLELVPIGVVGELHIGGAGLARGYMNHPEKTSAKFIPHPFARVPGARLYKTGDLARFRLDGQVEVCGRADNQVKIHGFRIELEEIEAAIARHPEVRDTVVLAREDEPGDKRLVAYVVPAAGARTDDQTVLAATLRRFLKGKLPHYMVPAALVMLEAMPLSPNGKINRKMLPAPDAARQDTEGAYIKPRDPLEHQLAQIWEELFSIGPIGIRDSFFDLGGHSLLAVRMMDRIEQVLGKSLPLATLFAGATIEHLAQALLNQAATKHCAPVVEIQRGAGRRPFFYLHGDFNGGGLYCRSLARQLGSEQPFYALQPHGLNGQPVPTSIEAMAEFHLRSLREVQPTGPYMLGGHCNGGLIAFEMARRLEREGERVALLALICTAGTNTRFRTMHRISEAICALRRKTVDERQQHFSQWRERAIRYEGLRDYYRERVGTLMRAPLSEQAMFIRRNATQSAGAFIAALRNRAARATPPANSHIDHRVVDERRAVIQAYDQAIEAYVPRHYGGRVTLLWPEELPIQPAGDATCGWRKAAAEVDTHIVPGGHLTCITKYVEEVAERLKLCLQEQ